MGLPARQRQRIITEAITEADILLDDVRLRTHPHASPRARPRRRALNQSVVRAPSSGIQDDEIMAKLAEVLQDVRRCANALRTCPPAC